MPPFSQRRPSKFIDQRTTDLGGKSPATVMVACGEVLRMKPEATESATSEAEAALLALSLQDLETALGSVSTGATRGELKLALSDAFEAAFADVTEERALYGQSAAAGLAARDKVASICAAAQARLSLGQENGTQKSAAKAALGKLSEEMRLLDAEVSKQVRSLTGINRERRIARDKLNESERALAWWYSARSDEADDRLLAALGDILAGSAIDSSTSGRTDCSAAPGGASSLPASVLADLAASEIPEQRTAGIESALRRVALGSATSAERDWLTARVAGNPTLQTALSIAGDASFDDIPPHES
jgi:hypothetical protein